MKVLDLDLDYFINKIKPITIVGDDRLSDDDFCPWTKHRFIEFLEKNCKLSKEKRVRGRIITHHHEAYLWWKELIEIGDLRTPFTLVHVDAHSDMAFGGISYQYIASELLEHPFNERPLYDKGLHCGNFIPYAIANRWIKEYQYLIHPKWDGGDLPDLFFKDFNCNTRLIELKRFSRDDIKDISRLTKYNVLEYEPVIPFTVFNKVEDFVCTEDFDFVCLSISPGYTPASADELVELFSFYIRQ